MTNPTQTFGGWLRRRRRELDLTQEALAQLVGCARITIRKLEADDMRPSRQLAELLVERLAVPADERASLIRFSRGGSPTNPALLPQHNLPHTASSFVGREKELSAIQRLLSGSRLVTLTGAGGIGKTRLALQVAREVVADYPDGVWWVELAARFRASAAAAYAGAGSEDPISQAVAKSLRLSLEPGRPAIDAVLEALRAKKTLLVFDNCEHVIEDCAALAEQLLAWCPLVCILATSQEALQVPGEKVWLLPALSLPKENPAPGAGQVLQAEAVRLFVERADEGRHGYQPAVVEVFTIAQICRRLDGIPLAIELAAANLSLLSAQEIADRLDQRFDLLTRGRRTALPRHRTLRAAIEWSHELLRAPEQIVFRRLAVFTGSFSLDGAEAINAGLGARREETLAVLGQLVDKSLLVTEPAPQDGAPATRYRYLDTIRAFGRLKLEETGETQAARNQHADYYAQLAEAAEPHLLLRDQVQWFRLLQAEYANLRAAIEWCAESRRRIADCGGIVLVLVDQWSQAGGPRPGIEIVSPALGSAV
jgi:predicted ATPase/DNA-binding XRE family transcriptional regulator